MSNTFRISYIHDDYNGHYVHGGDFDVTKEQLLRFLRIIQKYMTDRTVERDDEIFIRGITEWQKFFFHEFGFFSYAAYYEINIYTHNERIILDCEKIDEILSSLQ
jgi:hypothetical protein